MSLDGASIIQAVRRVDCTVKRAHACGRERVGAVAAERTHAFGMGMGIVGSAARYANHRSIERVK